MRKLRYLGAPSNFVRHLIDTGHRDSATQIRATLLEVCQQGLEHERIEKHGEKDKLYRIQSLPGDSDGLLHPGYEAVFLLLDPVVLVLELRPLSLE